MERAHTASAFLRRLHPWLGKAVHTRWNVRRTFYQREVDALLMALQAHDGRLSPELRVRLERFLGRPYPERVPATVPKNATHTEESADFRWALRRTQRWGAPA